MVAKAVGAVTFACVSIVFLSAGGGVALAIGVFVLVNALLMLGALIWI